ncbi:MAG: hypothetical protein AB1633_07280 [Elusimicrobiota bacterium]
MKLLLLFLLISFTFCFGQEIEKKNPDGVPSISITPFTTFGNINISSYETDIVSSFNFNLLLKIPVDYRITLSMFYNFENYAYGKNTTPNLFFDSKYKVNRVGGTNILFSLNEISMKKIIVFSIFSIILLCSCHSAFVTKFDSVKYESTKEVKIVSDPTLIKEEYVEIGIVEAKGGMTVTRDQLLEDMIEKAKQHGADAIINIDFYDRQNYDKYIGSYEKPAGKAVMIKFKKNIKN